MSASKALVLGSNVHRPATLLDKLRAQGCLSFANDSALQLVCGDNCDLILVQLMSPDVSADPLLETLDGSKASVFVAVALRDGAVWFRVMIHGESCWSKPTLFGPEHFFLCLEETFTQAVPTSAA
jgi:hypothetical protein